MLYSVAAVAFCVRVRGAGANLNTVKRIVTYTGIKPIFYIDR